MKVKSPSLLFNSAVKLMGPNAATVPAKNRPASRMRTSIGRAAFLVLLALLAWVRQSPAQSGNPIGLPVIFVHGICDTPDSFVPAERDLMTYLGKQYPALYTSTVDFVAFYNGSSVGFQTPQGELPTGSPNPVYSESEIDPDARFFLVALDDPSQTSYENFDPSVVADIPIYTKGNELAQIIWQVKVLTGAPRVIVVAHSMGGLDARAYIEGLASPTGSTDAAIPYVNDIAALVTLDTPHGGADASNWNWGGGIVNIPNSCAANPSIDKGEMLPSGTDPWTGAASVIPQMNYQELGVATLFSPNPLPSSLTITSIASSWTILTAPLPLFGPGDDNVLSSEAQDLETNLQNAQTDSLSTLVSAPNYFGPNGLLIGPYLNFCGIVAPLHLLTCTGSATQTFSLIETAVLPSASATSGQVQISPATSTTAPGKSVSFTATTGSSTIWSILEGANGGSITSGGIYQAPGNHNASTETYHVVALNGQNPSQYAVASIQVSSSSVKTATTTVLTPTASQVPVGASLTISATVQASGGTPTGTVTFYDGAKALSPEILNNAGVATYSTSSLALGFHSITAQYGDDSNYTASTSSAVTIAIVAIDPQLSVSPTSGTPGVTSFVKSDTGFTPYKLITHTATFPDNSVSVLQTNADLNGSYSYSRTYAMVGKYTQIDTDVTTGQTTTPVSWTVAASVANDFSLSFSPTSQIVIQGGSVSYNIVTTTTSGTAQTVSFGASNLPSGLSATFSPTSVTTGSQSTLTITASASAPVGTYTLVIAASSSYTTHTYQISVTVAQTQTGPVMTVTPSIVRFNDQSVGTISSPQTVVLRNSGTGQLIITGIGLASGNTDYALSLSGFSSPLILNQGVTYSLPVYFEPIAAGTRPGQIVIYDNAPGSPQVVSLTGNGLAAQPTTGTINVNATLNGVALPALYYYQYSLTGPTIVTSYDNNSFSVTAGSYSIAFQNNPSNFALSSVTPSASQTVAAGGTATFTLNFTAPDDFYGPTFLQPPGGGFTPQIVPVGSTATYYVDVAALVNNASTPITLSVFGAPSSSTPTFNPEPIYSGTGGTLTIGTTSGATPPGVYSLTLSGTNVNGITHVGSSSALAVTTPPATPVQLVSQSSSGSQANSGGTIASNSVSANGRLVVFSSTSTNLAPGATAGNPEVYVRDLQASTTTLVSVSNSGAVADSWCYGGSISSDGNFVEFSSLADNLYPGSVLNAVSGIYVRDLTHGATEREDLAPDGTPSNGNSTLGVISGDGRFVAFISTATNLVSGGSGTQAYLRDRKTGQTVLISSATDGTPANGSTSSLAISADGRYVGFVSNATNLVSANTGGLYQAFVRDMVNGTTSLVSAASSGIPANTSVIDDAGSYPPAISADGRYIAFSSYATNLVPQPTDGISSHNFVYDRQTQQMSLVDVDSVGTPLGGTSYIDASMSIDGRFIAFYGFDQVLVRDTVESQTAVVSLAAGGQAGNNSTWGWNIGLGGSRVAFASTATNLVSKDLNGQADAFVGSNPFVGNVSLNSVSLGSSSASGGSTLTGTVSLTGAAPAEGAVVSVWSNNDAAQPPAVVTVPAGATSASFSFSTSLVPSETVMTIMAAYNGGSGVAVLTLEPTPELTASPSSYDFGYQAVGTTSAIESFALTNSGTAPLAINSVQLATGQVFKIGANTCGSSIAAGGSCSVSVTFAPSAAGSASDAVQISYGSPATTFSISLTGNGAIPVAALTPAPLSFGNQSMPGSSTEVATLTNSGNASLSSISASIAGTNAGDFSISSDGCSGVTLPPNSNCLVTVSFSPKAKGNRAATLSIADSASGSPQTISLTGTGVQSTPTLLWSPSAASITYGTPLGTGVLDATANQSGSNLAGTFAYTATMSSGTPQTVTQATVLVAGTYTLTATFTPTDATDYTTATATTTLTVNKATSSVTTWPTASSITYGQTLASSTLSGGASTPAGSFAFTTPATKPNAGAASQSVTFMPTDSTDYSTLTGTASVTVNKATPTITWNTPAAVTVGTVLSSTQLNPTASVTGNFSYNPTSGTVMSTTGNITLTANFSPNDTTDYNDNSAQVVLVVTAVGTAPVPVISGISPAFTSAGGAIFTLTVTGSEFTTGSTVYWGTSALATTYGSATQLTAQVPATDIATGGTTAAITVQTPSPGGGTSNSFQFEVNSASGSTTGPTFSSTTATITAGSPASYPVTLPSSVESASVTCLNLPTGATCSYSATTNTLTITTSSTSPKGTYQITVVFTETVSGAATSWILLPILLLPLVYLRRKLAARGVWVTACLGLVLLAAVAYTSGCGGSSGGSSSPPPPQTHQVVSSGSVSITIQ